MAADETTEQFRQLAGDLLESAGYITQGQATRSFPPFDRGNFAQRCANAVDQVIAFRNQVETDLDLPNWDSDVARDLMAARMGITRAELELLLEEIEGEVREAKGVFKQLLVICELLLSAGVT